MSIMDYLNVVYVRNHPGRTVQERLVEWIDKTIRTNKNPMFVDETLGFFCLDVRRLGRLRWETYQ